ncbi:FadR/GntR family transcriptional regulator [Lichenifustis flavocetrariae]|uniref:FadR family transcriptional regulator n=1 Tax=Lichenifustis flavocetrariae TaxID=2949735 RepID=A0AA41Z0K9_9HYPH|nr:FadR/GntR family transcriptional regulator [Lichenifustis flavocetrariae]MCW6507107.1 FadR family transcriptional regulator [Lichenifustis flavocetrariae]
MALKLDKVSRGPHLPTLVASSLSREIAQGRLAPGAQLPTEQALAQTFGVSRNVIREAIARLRSEGRVWSQQGRGAFVSDAPPPAVLTIDHEGLHDADNFRSLFELRGILEVQAAALAAERRSTDDLDKMRAAHEAMAAAIYGSIAWLNADLDVHRTIAAATGNGYMLQFLSFVSERVRDSILASGNKHSSEDVAQITLGEHERILAAIGDGNAEEAQAAMRAHLVGAAQRVGVTGKPSKTAMDDEKNRIDRVPSKRQPRQTADAGVLK